MSTFSMCTTHPSTEAIGRCKQCGKPFCGECRVIGPTGNFCSEACRKNHEAFVERAKQLGDMKSSGALSRYIRNAIQILVILAIAIVIAHYMGMDVPVFGDYLEGIIPQGE